MFKDMLARMFPVHQWDECNGRRTCAVCQRVEQSNEMLGLSWDVTAKGDSSKHAIKLTDSTDQPSPDESALHSLVG